MKATVCYDELIEDNFLDVSGVSIDEDGHLRVKFANGKERVYKESTWIWYEVWNGSGKLDPPAPGD